MATYRQTVLRAFKDVEDNLAHLRLLRDQMHAQDQAVSSARRAAHLSQIQYREGSVSHLNVIDADRSVLQQRRVAVQLDADRAQATVNLIRAIGGSWNTNSVHAQEEVLLLARLRTPVDKASPYQEATESGLETRLFDQ